MPLHKRTDNRGFCLAVTTTLALILSPSLCLTSFADDTKTDEASDAATTQVEAKPLKIRIGQIPLSGSYAESAKSTDIFGATSETLAEIVARIDKTATDENIDAVVLNINEPALGFGQVNEIRQAISRVRQAGKEVHAYMDSASTPGYMVATACDSIAMPESGTWMVLGLRAEVAFYKNMFDKLNIQADMLRMGEYKSAAEPYTRSEMSPEFREEMEEIINGYFDLICDAISQGREISRDKAESIIDTAPHSASKAKSVGLIDHICYRDEHVKHAFKGKADAATVVKNYGKKKVDTDFSGLTGMVKMMNLMMGVEPRKRATTNPKIAVIYASGMIMSGKSTSSLFSGDVMGSDTIVKAVETAIEDDTVKAIVLRIDSPGGSALASDLMWRALEKCEKPFVVSMGNTAASGGYYIAMGADVIYAEPGTLTGSIGVVGGKVAIGGVYEKVGITTSVVSRGKNSGIMSMNNGFTDSERESMMQMLRETYKLFVSKAAKGRGMEYDALEKLARGRVYTGVQAKKIGLVDKLGTLDQAIEEAKALAKLDPAQDVERLEMPKPSNPLEALFGPMEASVQQAATPMEAMIMKRLDPNIAAKTRVLSILELLGTEKRMLTLPYSLQIR